MRLGAQQQEQRHTEYRLGAVDYFCACMEPRLDIIQRAIKRLRTTSTRIGLLLNPPLNAQLQSLRCVAFLVSDRCRSSIRVARHSTCD